MDNNAEFPNGWPMPDDPAQKVVETLNGKSISPEEELQDALDEMARDISLIEPNPKDSGEWVIYLLEQLQAEANRRRRINDYENMLNSLLRYLGG